MDLSLRHIVDRILNIPFHIHQCSAYTKLPILYPGKIDRGHGAEYSYDHDIVPFLRALDRLIDRCADTDTFVEDVSPVASKGFMDGV